jgi:nicotinamidase-related amidase
MSWREDVAALPQLSPVEFELDPRRTGLLVVDMQYVDAHRDHGLGKSLKQSHPEVWSYYFDRVETLVVPNVARLLAAFRAGGLRVVHLTLGPVLPDGADMVALRRDDRPEAMDALFHHQGTFEHRILEELSPLDGELVINKTSRSAFNSTAIERVLRNLGLDALVVCGVTTSSCVDTTARDAADRGFKTVIVEDAAAELDEPSHDAALRQFAVRWGRVWTTSETLAMLSATVADA